MLFASVANAQQNSFGIPYFENIPFSEISYDGTMGDVVQDANDVIFVANENGVLMFDGTQWQLLPTHGMPMLCRDNKGNVYVATANTVGVIERNEANQPEIRSLLADSVQMLGKISSIAVAYKKVYVIANRKLLALKDGVAKEVDFDGVPQKLFVSRNCLYVSTASALFSLDDKECVLLATVDSVIDVDKTDDGLLALTSNGIVLLRKDKPAQSFSTAIDKEWETIRETKIQGTAYNTICVGTSNGLYCFGNQGQLLYALNEDSGLADNQVRGMVVDKNSNVWVTTRKGISRIEQNPAITYYNKYNGLSGCVCAIANSNGLLYAGTDQGVFSIGDNGVKKICEAACQALVVYKNRVIAATEQGVLDVAKSETVAAALVSQLFVIDDFLVGVGDDSVVEWEWAEKLSEKHSVALPHIEITTMAKDRQTDCFAMVGTKHEGVWKLEMDSTQHLVFSQCAWPGMPKNTGRVDVFETTLGCLFSTYKGFFRCDYQNEFFYRDGKIILPEADGDNRIVSPVVEDGGNNLWMAFHIDGVYENQIAVAWNTNNLERYTLITSAFAKVQKFHATTIFADANPMAWIGGSEGIVRMDFNRMSVRKTLGDVQLVQVKTDDNTLVPLHQDKVELAYDTKSVMFTFVSVEYENHDDIQYSYYLEGQDNGWSDLTAINKKEYTNLPAGKYVFHVMAKRASGAKSKETTFEFEVKQHPLLSVWALAFYAILLFALALWIVKLRSKSLQRENMVVSKIVENKTKDLQDDIDKSETLLTNMLPDEAARELKETGKVRSMNFDMVTVLFSDFKGFTKIANRISADALIKELDKYFSEFDKIVERYNVEKIKTIGDAYMCAGGIPKKNTTNPIEVVAVALEMQYRLAEMQKELPDKSELWGVRIGVHTGPVIAGVVGSKKYSYDIWGDSVNVANRMESSGKVGRVNVSENTYLLIRDIFDCEYRGKIAVKGKDEKMDMYFVNGFKAQFAENQLRVLPNKNFSHKLDLLKFESLQEQIYSMLESKLPKNYFYHNLKHTIDVVVQVEVIGQAEGVSDEDMYILKTAALFHDIGFTQTYKNHERESIEIAKEILPAEGYSSAQIARISRLIEATILSEEPKNLLEQIIRDADLDYLGRNDYICVSRDLYKELLEMKLIKKNEYEWMLGQIKFLQEHKFYTDYSRRTRNPEKVRHIKALQEQITKFNNIA